MGRFMSGDNSKWMVIIGILLLAGLLWLQEDVFRDEKSGQARVVDGDSLEIGGERIRLKGIDAPELHQKCEKDGREWGCGRAATTALKRKIGKAAVNCDGGEFDRHERLLATCRAGEVNLNQWMVSEGWAVSFGGYYGAEERAAKAATRGIWQGRFDMPQVWRRKNPRY